MIALAVVRLVPARSHPHRRAPVRRRRRSRGRPPLRRSHPPPADRRPRPLLGLRRPRGSAAGQPAGRRKPHRRTAGRLRAAVDRGGGAGRHAAHGRPRLDLGHDRRCRDLRRRRQRDERHAGQPVPQGRRPRRRDRRRRRRLQPRAIVRRRARFGPGGTRTGGDAAAEAAAPAWPRVPRPRTEAGRTIGASEAARDELPAHAREPPWRGVPPAGSLLVAVIVLNPDFAEPGQIMRYIQRVAPVAIVAIGQYFVIVAGEFDLSQGSLITAQVIDRGQPRRSGRLAHDSRAVPHVRVRPVRRARERPAHDAAEGAVASS